MAGRGSVRQRLGLGSRAEAIRILQPDQPGQVVRHGPVAVVAEARAGPQHTCPYLAVIAWRTTWAKDTGGAGHMGAKPDQVVNVIQIELSFLMLSLPDRF